MEQLLGLGRGIQPALDTFEQGEADPLLGVGQQRLTAGCETNSNCEAPLMEPVVMTARTPRSGAGSVPWILIAHNSMLRGTNK
jgi:hypothetical protein